MIHGEAIRGTTARPFAVLDWGRCTQKPLAGGNTRLYLHVFNWPPDGKLVLPRLANQPLGATLVAGGQPLGLTALDNQITLTVPATAPDPIASVIALDVKGTAQVLK